MTAGEFCNRKVVVAHKSDTLVEAARRIRNFHVGALVVVDEQAGRCVPVGILTDRDMVVGALAGDGRQIDTLRVGDVMTGSPVSAHEHDDVIETIKRMRSFGIRRMPVVNGDGTLQGILSFDDLIDLVAEQLSDLTRLVAREQERERQPGHSR